jgi:hypothetical protein
MKPATTLKELLKPPFYHDESSCGHVFDGNSRILDVPGFASVKEGKDNTHLAHVRGWGFFQYFENGEELQDEFKDFVVQALNEKWERDFGNTRTCSCCYNKKDYQLFYRGHEMSMKYCPFCGRLLPPEEAHDERL